MKKILYDDSILNYTENNKKDIINYLIDLDIDPTPANIENCAIDFLHDEFNNLLSCISEYENKNNINCFCVVGVLGLWNGEKKIKVYEKNLKTLILKCCKYDFNLIYFDSLNTTLKIDSYHHDGVNRYKIYKVINNKLYAIKYNDLLSCY